ncbi:methyltransferase-like protein 25B [Ischnura elegans]|uniref:methyltransferase-like protein 25B n=1 Tax=Ischnura elegans TaxID=197161 RepID=UPI001ED88898|nr:methyltransferase-like protein 25B [Ischnura elegans]
MNNCAFQRFSKEMDMILQSANEELSVSIRKCSCILRLYSWLIDAYILDFFVEDLWKKLPRSWRETMAGADFSEVGMWLSLSQAPRYRSPWPLSLQALRVAVQSACLPRSSGGPAHPLLATHPTPATATPTAQVPPSDGSHECHTTAEVTLRCTHADALREGSGAKGLRRPFLKHVSPKKIHEIFKMADVVCQIAEETGVTCVVDVGSGIGHLARLLSFGHGLSVCCIEAQETLSCRARELDGEIKKFLSKIIPEERLKALPRPSHVTARVGPELEESDFIQMVSQSFQGSFHLAFGIVGLHPCGDLAPYLMQLFVSCSEARFLCIAGCCYMKLTPGIGFPLSSSGNDRDEVMQLSYEAREMACHAIEAYSRNLLHGNAASLKIHCYRATLESIILKNWPMFRRRGLKSIKYDENLQFPDYARKVLSAANLIPPEEDILSEETNECLRCWKQVVCFYSLRLMFAPLVETLILLDRCLFLSLKGVRCKVSPEFDPELSPRSHLLIASKNAEVV